VHQEDEEDSVLEEEEVVVEAGGSREVGVRREEEGLLEVSQEEEVRSGCGMGSCWACVDIWRSGSIVFPGC